MCPISSSPFLSVFNFHSLQVTGVSCNMLCFPTWVLMRQMNIHEEEADIAVWRLCSGWLCAWGLLWPHFWGICCAVGRHQGTLGSFANDADAWVLFWSVVVDDLFPRPFLSPSWLLELKFSLQLLVEDSQGVKDWEKRAAFLLPTLLLLFLPVVLTCDKGMPWVTSSGTISVFLFYLSLFVATFLIFCVFCIFFLWWLKLISPHVEGHIRNYVAHFNSKRLCSACLSCLLDCCFLLCTAHPLFPLLSFVLLFSFSSNSSYSNLSRFLPSFPFFAWQILIYIFSLAHHPVCLFSPRCHQPGAFSGPLSISYLPMLPFPLSASIFPPLFPCKISDPRIF